MFFLLVHALVVLTFHFRLLLSLLRHCRPSSTRLFCHALRILSYFFFGHQTVPSFFPFFIYCSKLDAATYDHYCNLLIVTSTYYAQNMRTASNRFGRLEASRVYLIVPYCSMTERALPCAAEMDWPVHLLGNIDRFHTKIYAVWDYDGTLIPVVQRSLIIISEFLFFVVIQLLSMKLLFTDAFIWSLFWYIFSNTENCQYFHVSLSELPLFSRFFFKCAQRLLL